MSQQRSFRASVVESLEERAVPSLFGLGGLGFGGRTATVQSQDVRQVQQAFNAVQRQVVQSIRGATAPTSTSTSGGTTTTTTQTAVQQALPQVRQAFSTFQSSYSTDVQNVLYQADPSGNINPSNNRVAFDARV